jgi:VanZ family protein
LNRSFLRSREFLWYWLPPLAWCGVVLSLSGDLGSSQQTYGILKWLLSWFPPLSSAQFNLIHFYVRKTVGHFGNYAFLYFLWFRALRGQVGYQPGRALLCSLGFCLGLALLDEGHQALFASRTSSLRDVALDLGGASTAALITSIFWTAKVRPAGNHKLPDPNAGT